MRAGRRALAAATVVVALTGCSGYGSSDDPAGVASIDLPVTAGEIAVDMITGGADEGFFVGFCNDIATRDVAIVYQAFRQAFARDIVYNAFGREIDNDPTGDDEAFVRSVFIAMADRCP